jgi:hypothetical protein
MTSCRFEFSSSIFQIFDGVSQIDQRFVHLSEVVSHPFSETRPRSASFVGFVTFSVQVFPLNSSQLSIPFAYLASAITSQGPA